MAEQPVRHGVPLGALTTHSRAINGFSIRGRVRVRSTSTSEMTTDQRRGEISAKSSTAVALSRGDVIAERYVVRREIARGGMAVVVEAEQRHTGRVVAVKCLLDEFANVTSVHERLMREARVLTTVRHPNIVEVLDAGFTATGSPYVVMEMLEGRTLEGFLAARGTLPVNEVLAIATQLCETLEFVHAFGVVHRDVKPSNVMIVRDRLGRETIKLIDFGVAALITSDRGESAPNARLTAAGGLVGTLGYMALEQLLAQPVDARSDVYSLGATLYECLAGDLPRPGGYAEIVQALAVGSPPRPLGELRADVPDAIAAVLDRSLAAWAAQRWPDMATFRRELSLAQGGAAAHDTSLLGTNASVRDESTPGVDHADGGPSEQPILLHRRRVQAVELHQRRHPRAAYITPVELSRNASESIMGRSEEISVSGMLVISDVPFRTGEWVTVRFAAPITGEVIEFGAMVRWARASGTRTSFGLEFVDAPVSATESIRGYVELSASAAWAMPGHHGNADAIGS